MELKCVTTPTLPTNDAAEETCSEGKERMGSGAGPEGLAGGPVGGLAGGLAGGLEGGFEGGENGGSDGGFGDGGSAGVEGEFAVAGEVNATRALQPSRPLANVPAPRQRKRNQPRGTSEVSAPAEAIAKGRPELKIFLRKEGFEGSA